MHKIAFVLTASLLVLASAGPAQAQPQPQLQPDDGYETYHDHDHDELDQDHQDEREYLEELHREAHQDDMSPWEHRLLHRYIERGHVPAYHEIDREHRRENGKSQWSAWYSGRIRHNASLFNHN
jgi:hypothetical protein